MSRSNKRIGLWYVLLLSVWMGPVAADEPALPPQSASDDVSFAENVQPFLGRYCCRCHGAEQQKAERRFDLLTGDIGGDSDLVDLQDIVDQLNLGEMPPPDERQPSAEDRRRVVRLLSDTIAEYHRKRSPLSGDTVLRRLNAREYANTVRDLLQIEMEMFDPTEGFPRDGQTEHLDNIGSTLVTSGYLLQRYLTAAERVVDKALTPLTKPEVQTWTFRDGFRQQPEIDQVHRRTNHFDWITLYEVRGADKHEGAYAAIHDFVQGVPEDGIYELRFDAEALNRRHPYDLEFLGTDPEEPLRLGIVPGDRTVGELHHTQPIEPLLTEIDLADDRQWYTVRIWLDAGMTPRFTFENGSMDVRSLWTRVLRKYPDMFPKPKSRGIVESRFLAISEGKFPQIRIHEVEIRGPIYEAWPTPAQRAILGADWDQAVSGDLSVDAMRTQLTHFLTRAYRRPALPDEIDRIMDLITARRAAGRTLVEAYGDGLKAALCSPAFLYLEEPVVDGQRLSAFALASRLSYFLWGSMPDDELLALAAGDALTQPAELAAQVERMLKDARSDAFVDGFPDSWLTLRELGATPPDRSAFPEYYQYDLKSAMRQETRLFMRHLIDQNLSVSEFLDSDFTFVNKALARHYGLPPVTGDQFQKVRLNDRRRGGLLGQASVLTVTANGIDTSPVVRGVWLLDNIFGTPPSPPPPDVEPLEPDARGATSIRDQLQKHRNVPSCNDCHRRIDPLGFALENYDPIGRWRETYDRRVPIDASGELPSGESFTGIESLKSLLVTRREQFERALTEKLLMYGTGRQLTPADRPDIDNILTQVRTGGGGLRDLITQVVLSDGFLSK
ncbi:MAG: DUF1592 domain-containing protein [Fuerstiella sp.]